MIVVDASALVAIAELEAEARDFVSVIRTADRAAVSAVNAVEAGLVLIRRGRLADVAELNRWLEGLEIEVDRHTIGHVQALGAFLLFGRNYHPAALNLGDCFAYALAKAFDAPLLFKGNDFPLTDVRAAYHPT